jgi:hypothetical protein
MVIAAFTSKAKDDLDKLARDIATAQQQPAATDTVQALYARFRDLQAATGEHAQLLSTSLDDTEAALTLVQFQHRRRRRRHQQRAGHRRTPLT